ncbi:purple acid phosphatase 17 [Brassica rapa]|uniref:Purple acid phosphatase n=2 Tax=Brassica campestris TaxID=3711 RepID=D6MW84_BRACM|nr:purple acid phosphatase 17 [Brassica rapa]ADG45866.1 purple acid phosphatase 17 isoform 1 [Brassica rapa]ADG45870.1 purple acid phosphatase 17 isoform 1 [Brassica rapa subsp. pekinensis]
MNSRRSLTSATAATMSFLLYICTTVVVTNGELQRFIEPAKSDGSVSFITIGDWGRRGDFNQSKVAYQMGRVGEKIGLDFVVSTGDNFYDNGLFSEYDPNFKESFSNIYTAPSLQKQWYSVLGNHDYRGDSEAQLSSVLREIDSRWICLRSFVVDAELVEIFFVDTTPFVKEYYTEEDGHTYDWRAVPSRNSYVKSLLRDLQASLKRSKATWKIVVGHHAMRSIGHHGDTKELIEELLPIMKEYGVDLYMNGHDHCLEHISDEDSPIQFLTSGAGSKAWRGDVDPTTNNPKSVRFYYDGQGFMSARFTHTDAEIVFYNVFGEVLHKWVTSKQLLLSSV